VRYFPREDDDRVEVAEDNCDCWAMAEDEFHPCPEHEHPQDIEGGLKEWVERRNRLVQEARSQHATRRYRRER